VTVDVVCAGPLFLDLTFEGLEELPGAGEERYARELHSTPGGAAITAIGLTRLGLRAAVASPLGDDLAGDLLRQLLERAGVPSIAARCERTAVTVAMPVGDERAMATFGPRPELSREPIERARPRAVVIDLDRLDLAPPGTAVYAIVGDDDVRRHARGLPGDVHDARALLANRAEALRLSGEESAEGAALALADVVETAVVTCGRDGAVAASDGALVSVPAPRVEVRDTTGAGDLFTAAYVWADLHGLPLAERVRRAVLYATLSVRTATGAASASTLEELERALAELDPVTVQPPPAKET
jgi:sugar/nucleoside kinase (ribokinase family)